VAGSVLLLRHGADSSVAAVLGSTGLVLATALLMLTAMAARWRAGSRRYATTMMDEDPFYDELLHAMFDDEQQGEAAAG
jgi:hypothetical protein